jgi:LmbE family N-acetylglucosaminyl deacetylase
VLGRYDSLFIAPHADDVLLACPARVLNEVERGRRVLVLALFAAEDADSRPAEAAAMLGAEYAAGGLLSAGERHGPLPSSAPFAREPADEGALLDAARLLSEVGPRTQAVHVFAPLGLVASIDHLITYEAAVRAFSGESGRNLFLYEERPEAFVPGAVRTRLARLGARLPPGAQRAAARVGLLRHLWSVNEPRSLRGERVGLLERLAALRAARHRLSEARPWNPLRALGPRLQPIVHMADEEGATRARAVAERILAGDGKKKRSRAAQRFNARAAAAARRLGTVYHAERLWLFLPSGEGLPEVQHSLEGAEA